MVSTVAAATNAASETDTDCILTAGFLFSIQTPIHSLNISRAQENEP
jgi:hypothetical protein